MSETLDAKPDVLAPWREVLDCLREHPPAAGAADIFCMGRADMTRTAVLVAALACLGSDGTLFAKQVMVILPPATATEPAPTALRDAIVVVLATLNEQDPNAQMLAWLERRIRIVQAANLDVETLLGAFPEDPGRHVVVVASAARYSSPYVGAPPQHEILDLEDTWVARLEATAQQMVAQCKARGHYVLLDAGEDAPTSQANLERLTAVEDCGVLSGGFGSDDGPRLGELMPRWRDLLAAGRVGTVLQEIGGLPVTDRAKRRLKIQIMSRGGLHAPAMTLLKEVLAEGAALDAEVSLAFAEAASAAQEREIAERLLAEAGPRLSDLMLLERALHLAENLSEPETFEAVARRTESLFPKAPIITDIRVRKALHRRDYRTVSQVLGEAGRESASRFYAWLAEALEGDLAALPAALQAEWPDHVESGLVAAALAAEQAGDRAAAIGLLLARDDPARASTAEVMQLMRLTRLSLLHNGADDLDDELAGVLLAAFGYLGAHPDSPTVRLQLGRLISADVSGTRGFLAAVAAILNLLDTVPLAVRQAGETTSPEIDTVGLCRAVMDWFQAEGVLGIGRAVVPTEILTPDFDPAIANELVRTLEHMGGELATDEDVHALMTMVGVVTALAPHLADPDTDLTAIRVTAAQLIVAGGFQKARDLVEVTLQIAGDRPERRRNAWVTYGDTYLRVRDYSEALLAFGAALTCVTPVASGQAWTESLALFRLFRDLGAVEPAREVLERARQVVAKFGLQEANQGILDTLALQLEVTDATTAETPEPDVLQDLLARTGAVCRDALDYPPELAPIASLLSQVMRSARLAGMTLDGELEALHADALGRIGEPLASTLRIHHAASPTAEDLAALAGRIDTARYATDVGFDVGNLALLARRYLAGAATADDPKLAVYAIELLADQAVAADDEGTALPQFPTSSEAPLETARKISRTGLGVAMLGLDERSRLVRAQVVDGEVSPPIIEAMEVFDAAAYEAWRRRYPYAYGFIDEPRRDADGRLLRAVDLGGFAQSLQGIGVSDLPAQRTVLVLDTNLQLLPPNILKVGDDLAGAARAMAMVPSLSWLRHAASRRDRAAAPSLAWVSTASAGQGLPALGIMAERLAPALETHGIALDTGAAVPAHLKAAELAIVGAHGGLQPVEGRYFQSVADEDRLRIEMRTLAGALAGAKIAVLFVCSGGRVDAAPHGRAAIGLARRLLDQGCSAVIGSPWPLSASVPPYWLPTFLEAWRLGLPVIDANQYANDAVRKALGDKPELCLAMSVYGDPLVRKIGT